MKIKRWQMDMDGCWEVSPDGDWVDCDDVTDLEEKFNAVCDERDALDIIRLTVARELVESVYGETVEQLRNRIATALRGKG